MDWTGLIGWIDWTDWMDCLEERIVDSVRRRFLHVDTEKAMLRVLVFDGRI